jgi:hypothetical protein
MTKYDEEMAKGRKARRVDGPFAETKELIAGYWLIQVKSKEEAINLAKRCPPPQGEGAEGEIELRQLFELEDLAPSPAIEDAQGSRPNWRTRSNLPAYTECRENRPSQTVALRPSWL